MSSSERQVFAHQRGLFVSGTVLFLGGLLVGFLLIDAPFPRAGYTAHLEGCLNGVMLIIFGLVWDKPRLSPTWRTVSYICLQAGTWFNFLPFVYGMYTGGQFTSATKLVSSFDATGVNPIHGQIVTMALMFLCAPEMVLASLVLAVGFYKMEFAQKPKVK